MTTQTVTLDRERMERISSGVRGMTEAMRSLERSVTEAMRPMMEVARRLRDADAEGDPDEPEWGDAHRWQPGGEDWRP